ncbi:NADH-FMN oxidoreductase RutF, flavin reductase (DIM6/NTAB) family [Parapedobacter indicus]|uniref:NADH-FMN oxidoreductase RutF, flavin reductase (DIM6/NTAB) family n=2 Tax=Parapedobacter indicus TaxID=1477437 RepID=A0A1I3IW45_9SPHI|nr:flavin reductase (DIM6/NTAB) family NADH-FMN oxidoreductase RutF [Parapedobacter indicus]SFI52176.1 NADH-FMN oxidoreductase RutF, flavin reductase (DIM6/NTAB) family [Parapedobacter indicus]
MQGYLHHAIAPRPICFASTINKNGEVNLSPFSFFNVFSINPPICVFSPTSRARDNTAKHTLENVLEIPECVINIVNYEMVQQTYLTSKDYPREVNEFSKAGFTELASETVKPPRVAESTVQLECVVNDVISLGKNGGAGNLVIAEVKRIHINEDILDANGKIDPHKMDLVARLGGDWYCRVTSDNLFKIAKPIDYAGMGIGIDAFPKEIKNSNILTGNNLGLLGLVKRLPSDEEVESFSKTDEMKELLDGTTDSHTRTMRQHLKAKHLLDNGRVMDAWKVLLM